MDCSGAGSGDRQAAIVSGDLHPVLLRHGLGVIAGFFDVVQDQIQAFQRIQIAEGICLVAGKALDAVCQCIHTGSCCDLAGQVLDHACIQNDIICDHVLIDNADLQFLFRYSHDGIGGDLCAGACGRRDEHDGHALLCHAGVVQQLLDAVVIRHQYAGQLGSVHHAAAAAGHNQVCTGRFELVHQFLHGHVARLRRQVIQHIVFCTCRLDCIFRQGKQSGAFNSLIREHCHFFCAPRLDDRGDVVHCVLTAINCMRHFQVILCKHFQKPPCCFDPAHSVLFHAI